MKRRLLDVREYAEFSAGHIEGAESVPLSQLARKAEDWSRDLPLAVVCRTSRRAGQAQRQLRMMGFQDVQMMECGVEGWKASGGSLVQTQRVPWSLERQVRIAAGSLVLITLVLALTVSSYFLAGTALVGMGLVFAGISDICMMASLLGRLPWNRQKRQSA